MIFTAEDQVFELFQTLGLFYAIVKPGKGNIYEKLTVFQTRIKEMRMGSELCRAALNDR